MRPAWVDKAEPLPSPFPDREKITPEINIGESSEDYVCTGAAKIYLPTFSLPTFIPPTFILQTFSLLLFHLTNLLTKHKTNPPGLIEYSIPIHQL
jgi:hypothetical protein